MPFVPPTPRPGEIVAHNGQRRIPVQTVFQGPFMIVTLRTQDAVVINQEKDCPAFDLHVHGLFQQIGERPEPPPAGTTTA